MNVRGSQTLYTVHPPRLEPTTHEDLLKVRIGIY